MTPLIVVLISGLLGLWLLGERGSLLRKSTRRFMREQGLKNVVNFKALHGYVYMRWTRQYIAFALHYLLPRSTEKLRKSWADQYHSKVLTDEQARAVITLNRKIDLRDLEQVIPYPTARNLVLNGPPDVVVYECVCRAARKSPCQPTQVCMIIGQPFADFILEHHPGTSRRLTQAEALTLLRQEHERGHVHTAWFKDVMLERFFAICNCCSCCCGAFEAKNGFSMPNIAASGYSARVDAAKCESCGACGKACPFQAIRADGIATVQWDKCMGCGVCETRCAQGAISLVRDEKKGIPMDVRALSKVLALL